MSEETIERTKNYIWLHCWKHILRHQDLYLTQSNQLQGERSLTAAFGCAFTPPFPLNDRFCQQLWDANCPYNPTMRKTIVTRVLWPKLRAYVKHTRPIAIFWLDVTVRAQYAEGGAGRTRDREAFESDNAWEMLGIRENND